MNKFLKYLISKETKEQKEKRSYFELGWACGIIFMFIGIGFFLF